MVVATFVLVAVVGFDREGDFGVNQELSAAGRDCVILRELESVTVLTIVMMMLLAFLVVVVLLAFLVVVVFLAFLLGGVGMVVEVVVDVDAERAEFRIVGEKQLHGDFLAEVECGGVCGRCTVD